MKYVVIGEPSGATLEQIMKVLPRHRVVVQRLAAQGVIVGIGPFSDLGNLGIFRTREAAEEFVRTDPFYLEGLVKNYRVREWDDDLLT